MIDNQYNQFRILYLLHSNPLENSSKRMNIDELLGTEDLRHILKNKELTNMFRGDIDYLIDSGFLRLQGGTKSASLEITSKGKDALNIILEAYVKYLKQQPDSELQRQYRHISSLPDIIKGPEIFRYSKDKYGATFKKFLESTKIFDRFSQIAPIIQETSDDLLQWADEVIALSNQPIERRIIERENGLIERKSSFRYDRMAQGKSKKLEKETSIAISGFMNGHGGILIIGVDTAGNVLGLSKDYAFVHNKNSDGFERELRNSIEKHLKNKVADTLIEVRFWPFKEGEICEVIVKPSSKPMVLFDGDKQEFYVRVGNSTKLYPASAMLEYCRRRFRLD